MTCNTRLPSGFLSTSLRWVAVFGVLALLSAPTEAVAQQTGTISGRVTDEQGSPLAGAVIVIEEIRKGALTNATGNYLIADVPPGTHTVRVRFIGYRPQASDVSVSAGGEATQDFTLAVDPLGLEELVITATNEPRVKLESSTAITTMTSTQIREAQPRSTSDLLTTVPGFYVESSGGNVNNNLWVRGLPQDGSFRYVTFLENGIPANDGNDFFFLGADNFIRVDENIDRIEAVRGGNSALFGGNAPGGLVNYIDKTGGPEFSGVLGTQVATDGLNQYDFNLNGPIVEEWRFNIGGFYRFDNGVRNPGFPASRGGQIKANITRLLDRGSITVYAKYLNDSNQFLVNVPLIAEASGPNEVEITDEFVPGFPSDGTLTTREANFTRIPLPRNNGEFILPLQDGIRSTGATGIVDLNLELEGGWQIRNTLRGMFLNHANNAMPPGRPVDAAAFVDPFVDEAAGETGVLVFTNQLDANGDKIPFNTPNNLVETALLWHVERPVSNISNQFILRKRLTTGELSHNLTFGAYFGHYTAEELRLFNGVLTEVRNAPRLLDLVVLDAAGDTVRRVTDNGFTAYLSGFKNAFGNATLFSFFAGAELELTDRLRVDVGGRFERDEFEQNVENTAAFDLTDVREPGVAIDTEADDAVLWGIGSFQRVDVDFNEWAASLGINYTLTDQVALYARGARGYRMPFLDNFSDNPAFPDTAETIYQAEGGVKISTPWLGLSGVVYWLRIEDFPSQDVVIEGGVPVFRSRLVGAARTIGAEVEAVVAPAPGLRLNAVGTFQDPKFVDFVEQRGSPPVPDTLNGNRIRRLPRVILKLGGSYRYRGFSIGGDWNFYGSRFSDQANTIVLPEYGYVNARISYAIPGQGITVFGGVQNLLDGVGRTEGDPRFDETSGAPTGGIANARTILPIRWLAGIRYNF